MRQRVASLPLVAIAVLTLAPASVNGQNLVVNPDFDTGLQGWLLLSDGTSDPSAAIFWSPDNGRLRPTTSERSGSALLAAIASPVSTAAFGYLYQPGIPVTAGAAYLVGGGVSVARSSTGVQKFASA